MKAVALQPESMSKTGCSVRPCYFFLAKALFFWAAIKGQAVIRRGFPKNKKMKKVNKFLKSFRHFPLMISTAVALHTPGKANQS
ncbi:MAG: hypothetical protein JNK97_14440 [Zoogloea sp.]|nr:hypothetical protein [Zoogloea sp.]